MRKCKCFLIIDIYIFIYQNIFYVAPCSIYMHYISMFGFRQMIFTNMIYP